VFFLVLVLFSIGLLIFIVWPLIAALFLASVLASALHPWQVRLARRLGERPRLAAGILTLLVVVALVVPLAIMGAVIVDEVTQWIQIVRTAFEQAGTDGVIDLLPERLREITRTLVRRTPLGNVQLQDVSAPGGRAAAAFGGVVGATGRLVLQTVLMLIMLFFLLVDGRALVVWLSDVMPLPVGQFRELLHEVQKVSHSVLFSSLATAAVQTVAALVGYLIAAVPHPFFFALVTFFFALIPVIGAGGISLGLGLMLLLGGRLLAGGFLVAWALLVVGLADNLVKPLLIRADLRLHGAVVFFSLLGGLLALGPIGLLVGPLAVTFFLALMRILERGSEGAPGAEPVTAEHGEDTAPVRQRPTTPPSTG
jgi:predicted PurR-regulated permease PerM